MAGLAARGGEGDFGEPFTFAGMAASGPLSGLADRSVGSLLSGVDRSSSEDNNPTF